MREEAFEDFAGKAGVEGCWAFGARDCVDGGEDLGGE